MSKNTKSESVSASPQTSEGKEDVGLETPTALGEQDASKQATRWEYNKYRATLKLDGKFFAIVTPNGKDALSQQEQNTLLDSLNK